MSTLALAPKTLAPEIEFDEPPSRTKPATPRRALSRRTKLRLLGVPALTLVVTAFSFWLAYAAKFEETDDAFIEADVHPVSSRIIGDVLEVLVLSLIHI